MVRDITSSKVVGYTALIRSFNWRDAYQLLTGRVGDVIVVACKIRVILICAEFNSRVCYNFSYHLFFFVLLY